MNKSRGVTAIIVLVLAILGAAPSASAQGTLNGVVVDQLGGAIAGATIVVRSAGAPVQTATTDASGTFWITGLAPGRYEVEARNTLFEATRVNADVPRTGVTPSLRLTLGIAGVVESMVVTGRRVATRLSETPQTIEVISSRDIDRSVAADITDVLKKNSGVEVIQYNSVLSGIGIRGFRPEFSGINKRSLLLIDGRPSGVTNLATLLLNGVDHIEVLKGPASAVYGSSAMGGVVNVITKHSRGEINATGRGAFGSFAASEFAGAIGGSLSRRVDFDVNGSAFNQRDDYRMGNGVVRPATTYKTYDGSARVGADLSKAWRLDARVNAYRGRDIDNPGDVFNGINSQGRKNLERSSGDIQLSGQIGRHLVSSTVYGAAEQGHISNVRTTNPLDQPFLPFLSFENKLGWVGVQVKDAWSWNKASSLVFGLDSDHVDSESRSYSRTGARQGPFSADNSKHTLGVYAENTLNLNNGRTIISVGGRVDRIKVATADTPFKTNFTPSTTSFSVFNPSVGVKQHIVRGLRVHATAGRAFVPADAGALTGFTTTFINGRTQITQGNPDLKPERSFSFDSGVEWMSPSTHVNVTYFQTTVDDRVISNVLISKPVPPEPIILSTVNALASHIYGMDVDFAHRLSPRLSAFSNITHYFSRKEQLPTTGERNILNVATNTVRAGVDVDLGRLSSRVSTRYVRGRQDQDFNVAGAPVVNYPNFAVVDLSATYRLHHHHGVVLTINNLLDTYYYEKKGYPLAGTAFSLKYRFGLR